MIAQSTIDSVYASVDIVEIIGQFVELKKSGSSYQGKSPFNEEKTPSFYVVPSKDIFKDFSSGKGGSVITFLEELKGWTYPEIIEYLAKHYSIEIKYEKQSKEQQEQAQTKADLKKIVKATARKYVDLRKESEEENNKLLQQLDRFSDDSLVQWQIGFAPDDFKYIYNLCQEKGIVKPAEQAGVLDFSKGNYFDYYRWRVIFPIQNTKGEIISFGGRRLDQEQKPKYINGRNTDIFEKSETFYGAHFAAAHIRKTETVHLVEGYADVIAMHEVTMENTVATLGTALSDWHVKWLKKNAERVVILRDGDAAGIRAAIKDMEMLLESGLEAQYVLLPDGKDPYDICHDIEIDDPAIWIEDNTSDALIHFSQCEYKAANTPTAQAKALDQITQWIALMPDDFVRSQYRKELARKLKVKEKDLEKREAQQEELRISFKPSKERTYDFQEKLPEKVTADDILRDNFYGIVNGSETGYYFLTKDWTDFHKVSNFVIEPLFHKYEIEDNTRVIRVQNGIGPAEIIEMPSSAMIGVSEFQKFMFDKGSYLWRGDKVQLNKLNEKYLFEFPKAFELKTLGWQNEGFYAFYNCVYNGTLKQYNDAGLISHDEKHYFSPAASNIYTDLRMEDDLFQNDRFMEYVESSISFEEWMELMVTVYEDHAFAGIPYALVCLFRDIVFKVDNNCPFLYSYGQSKSGKSKFHESITALFFKEIPAFNLNSGTDFAFAARLGRFRNAPIPLNEFDDNVLLKRKPEWFQAIKGAYDGEGRERGMGGSRRKTEIQKVNGCLLLVGQYLSTADDNSILSRSIMRTFRIQYDRPEDKIVAYNKLKEHEKRGITSIITKMLPYREKVEKEYYDRFNKIFKTLGQDIRNQKKQYDERVLRNYSALATMYDLFRDHFSFPWSQTEYMEWCKQEIMNMSSLLSDTDILVDFWVTINTLADLGQVREKIHFKVLHKTQIRVTVDGVEKSVTLNSEKKILYIKLREIQKLYAMQKKKEDGNPIDWTSLKSYLENREYYLGWVKRERMGDKMVSAFLFDYDALGLSLDKEPEPPTLATPDGSPPVPDEDLPF